MEIYTNVSWNSRELTSIAPDTHILKATVKLGLCSSKVLDGTAEDRQAVAKIWENVLTDSGLAPIDSHTPLWLWSRTSFSQLSSSETLGGNT